MKPRDVLGGTIVGGSVIGVLLMALGLWLLGTALSSNLTAFDSGYDLDAGSVFFAVGGAFLLVAAILIPALRAIQRESSQRDQ